MQNYDEAYFRAKANRRAGTTWLILLVMINFYYGIKVMTKGYMSLPWKVIVGTVG